MSPRDPYELPPPKNEDQRRLREASTAVSKRLEEVAGPTYEEAELTSSLATMERMRMGRIKSIATDFSIDFPVPVDDPVRELHERLEENRPAVRLFVGNGEPRHLAALIRRLEEPRATCVLLRPGESVKLLEPEPITVDVIEAAIETLRKNNVDPVLTFPVHPRSPLGLFVAETRREVRMLRRRALYGGRKARSAERRLQALERDRPNIVALEDSLLAGRTAYLETAAARR